MLIEYKSDVMNDYIIDIVLQDNHPFVVLVFFKIILFFYYVATMENN